LDAEYADILTNIELINAQYNESRFILAAANERFAAILSGIMFIRLF